MSNTTTLSQQLKNLIRKYEHRSFLAHWSFVANMHYRTNTDNKPKLLSPIRQLMYVISLYHSTDFQGKEYFEAYGEDYDNIISLLNDIEKQYSIDPKNLAAEGIKDDASLEKIFVSNSTFLNYYLNAPLSYMEQDIERIRRTFVHFESYIIDEFGLTIEDFIAFHTLISDLEIEQYTNYYNHTSAEKQLILKGRDRAYELTEHEAMQLIDLADKGVHGLSIPIKRLKESMNGEKVEVLLSIFTLLRSENEKYLYYTDPCSYLSRPVLLMDTENIVLIFSKQLINAIYEFLFEFCSTIDDNARRVLTQRENYLEYKTKEVFEDFFGKKAKIYANYTVSDSEKDLLVLTNKHAFIIECKANKFRIPFRNPIKAYDRIKDDFKKSIGKAYKQAKEIEDYFIAGEPFEIKDQKGKILDTIYPTRFDEVFTIVVTQERFGQIQCNLEHLLEIGEHDNFPWAVAIDDLETFLITLGRKKTHIHEFISYLMEREKLHGRLYCFDELELCANFIMQYHTFLKYCNSDLPFICSTDINLFFDELYTIGFGFKDELKLDRKNSTNNPIAVALVKELKLYKPLRLRKNQ